MTYPWPEDDGTHPPCRLCDDPCAVDPDGFHYEMCTTCIDDACDADARVSP